MKKLVLSGLALLSFLQFRAQETQQDSAYTSRKIKIEEINLISSYYHQDGNNSAVTGGIGTEKLTDIANVIDVRLHKYGSNGIKHNLDIEVGVDHYTSASSDKIDMQANSSASSADNRFYPSLTYSRENEAKGRTLTAGLSSSTEFDYQSFGGTLGYATKSKDKNAEFSAQFHAYLDQVKMILPVELRTSGGYGTENRNTFALTLTYAQVINKNLQVALIADVVQQQGYLALPFHRVYFQDGSVHQEVLPDSRFKIPIGARVSYFAGDFVVLRGYYRYYTDNWGLDSHTASLETVFKLSNALSLSPFYRYYKQTAVDYFKPYGQHDGSEQYHTSNYDLSAFDSHFVGTGLRWTPLKGIFGVERLHALEVRYGHYTASRNLTSDIISLNLQFK